MYPPLEAAWAKYNRASRDLGTLHDNRTRFLARQPYRVEAELEPDTGWWLARTRIVEEPPPVFGVLVGSLAHQLYSALNHVAYALGVRHLGEAAAHSKRFGLDFPIAGRREAFKRSKLVSLVGEEATEILERLQPFHRPPEKKHRQIQHPLLLAKELADADKHRVLAASYGSIDLRDVLAGEAFKWDRDVSPTGEFERLLPATTEIRALTSGTPLARVRFDNRNADVQPKIDPQPDVDIVFESDTWAGLTLWLIGDCVATADRCISELAPLFPGEPWPPTRHDPTSPYTW